MIGVRARATAAAEQRHVDASAEVANELHRHPVAADQPIVAEHRRHGHRQAERRHDQRLATGPATLSIDACPAMPIAVSAW